MVIGLKKKSNALVDRHWKTYLHLERTQRYPKTCLQTAQQPALMSEYWYFTWAHYALYRHSWSTTGKPHLPSRCPSYPRNPRAQTPDPSVMPADPRCSQIPDWFKTPAAIRDQLFQMLSMRWLWNVNSAMYWEYIGDVIACLPELHQSTFLGFALELILFLYVNLGLFLFSAAAWTTYIQKLLLHFDSEQTILFRDHF